MKQDERTSETRAAELKEQIDQNLRRVYQEVLDEEIPQRFKDLLEELRRKTAAP